MHHVTKWATSGLPKLLIACLCLIGGCNGLIGSTSNTGDLTNTTSVSRRVTVQEGETAYRIARRYKPDSVTMDQMLLALLRENPGVFQSGNLHRIRAGSVLVIPSHPVVQKTSPTEATQVVQGQTRRIVSDTPRTPPKAVIAASVQPTAPLPVPVPAASSSQKLAERVSPVAEVTLAPVLQKPEQNITGTASKEGQGRFPIKVGIWISLMGAVVLLSLNGNRIQDRFRGWRRRSTIATPPSVSSNRRTQTVLEIMVSIRDFNRQMRLEIEGWIHSKNPTSIAVRPSVTNWKPSISVIPASGFQKIAQSDFVILQNHSSVSPVKETDMDVRFLGHGFHLDFQFLQHKPSDSLLDQAASEAETVERSIPSSHIQCPSSPQSTFQRNKSMKASGFSFSPSEYLANQQIQMMSLEEEGVYIRLLSYCWQNGSVPRDPEQAARLVGKGASTTVVASVLRLFQATQNPQELNHLDLQQQKDRLTQWKEKSAAGGRKSAASRKGGSTTLETVVDKNPRITHLNTQTVPATPPLPRKLAPPLPRTLASEPPEIDSKASQEAFERQAIAVGLLATDGAFLHRQWRSKDSELRAGVTSGWRQLMSIWKEQGRFPSQLSNPGGGRVSEKARPAPAVVIPPQSSRDFPKITASETPYSFRFDGFQTLSGS
ncbi:MAG: LysM peptidoglycan-binding domain-containing protein [Verrucomicrobia bacterium]|nr:LysM peptidoglycan-binding domain-containing protein [Verrucomicrobiota bacterium]